MITINNKDLTYFYMGIKERGIKFESAGEENNLWI